MANDNFFSSLFSRTSKAAPASGDPKAQGNQQQNQQNQQQQIQQDGGIKRDGGNPNPANFNPNGGNKDDSGNAAAGGSESPLDQFSKLWEDSANSEGGEGDNPNALFKLDPKKLGEAVSKIDFTKNIDPALVESALKGDSKALSQVINSAAQGAFGQALVSASQLVESGISKRMEKITGDIDARVKALGVQSQLRAKNAAFSHPSVKPLVGMIQERFAAQHPNASAEELHDYSVKYLTQLANIINPSKQSDGNNDGAGGGNDGEQDFSKYFENTPASLFPR